MSFEMWFDVVGRPCKELRALDDRYRVRTDQLSLEMRSAIATAKLGNCP
jgi:hypothetical protein